MSVSSSLFVTSTSDFNGAEIMYVYRRKSNLSEENERSKLAPSPFNGSPPSTEDLQNQTVASEPSSSMQNVELIEVDSKHHIAFYRRPRVVQQ